MPCGFLAPFKREKQKRPNSTGMLWVFSRFSSLCSPSSLSPRETARVYLLVPAFLPCLHFIWLFPDKFRFGLSIS